MRGMHVHWGFQEHTFDSMRGTPGSLREAILLFGYLFVWSVAMAAYIGIFFLIGVATLLLVLVWLPCSLWSRVSPKGKSQRSGHVPKARLIRQG